MTSTSSTLIGGLILSILISQIYSERPPEWAQGGGGNPYPKIKNSGPSKIFEWIGSRLARFPSILPKFPSFPKYEVPQKFPNYHVIMPEPPGNNQFEDDFPFPHGGDDGGKYQGPPEEFTHGSTQDGHGEVSHQFQHDNEHPPNFPQSHQNEIPQSQQEEHFKPSSSQYNQAPRQVPPAQYNHPPPHHNQPTLEHNQRPDVPPSQYNVPPQIPLQNQYNPPPLQYKAPESPIEVVPSNMVAYEKETYPPAGQGAEWQSPSSLFQVPPLSHSQYSPPVAANPVGYKSPNPTSAKTVPVTPHSTGPDYFNTAYYHGEGDSSQLNTPSSYQKVPEFSSLGAAYAHAQQNPVKGLYQQASNGLDFHQQDLGTLISSVDGGEYDGLNPPGVSTNTVPRYTAAPAVTGLPPQDQPRYFNLSPGVKVLQSQESGNPSFEIIADANAPNYNGHPFDINKLISMIEPGATLVDVPQASHEATGAEKQDIVTSAAATGTHMGSETDNDINSPIPSLIRTSPSISSESSSLKDLLKFFQQTDGKGFVVVEKKGPGSPSPSSLPQTDDDDTTTGNNYHNDLTTHEHGPDIQTTRINITANALPFLLSQKTTTPATPVVFFAVRTTTRHPHHNYKRKYPQVERSRPHDDLDTGDSNIKSIAITVTPPTKPLDKKTTLTTPVQPITVSQPPEVMVIRKTSSTISSVRSHVRPVYSSKKSSSNNTSPSTPPMSS